MRIIWGLVWIAIGFLLIKYAYSLVGIFGKIPWAENKLGGGMGGTYSLYKIVGVVAIFIGFAYMFGILEKLIKPLTSVFGG